MKTKEQLLDEHESERTRCTVYTRVMGYHRPVETFNTGKQGEFKERKHFREPFAQHEVNRVDFPMTKAK